MSYHFQAVDVSYKVLTNIQNGHVVSFYYQSKSFNLSVHFLPPQSQPLPYWQSYSEEQNKLFENLFVTKDEVISIEKELQNRQPVKNGNRVTSSNTHKMFMRKKISNHYLERNLEKRKKKIPSLSKMSYNVNADTNQLLDVNIKRLCNTKWN